MLGNGVKEIGQRGEVLIYASIFIHISGVREVGRGLGSSDLSTKKYPCGYPELGLEN